MTETVTEFTRGRERKVNGERDIYRYIEREKRSGGDIYIHREGDREQRKIYAD